MFATPPGSARRSYPLAPSASGGESAGSGMSRTVRSSSATGAGLSTICPVGASQPSSIALRQRTSTGSSPSTAASLSICASCANAACTEPNPRIAPHGGLLVYTPYASTETFATTYGPMPIVPALPTTAVVLDA